MALPAAVYAPPVLPAGAAIRPLPIAVPFRERMLLAVLYITVLASSVAFIEPSPHDGLMGVLAVAALIAGVRFHRFLVLPLLLLLIWNVSGLLSLFNVPGQEKTVQYTATSFYLAAAALIFSLVFAENTMTRMATMRSAYVLTAAVIALAGTAGYFHLFPGSEIFTGEDRALGGFKDPNVYGPFLILPLLMLLERMVSRRIDFMSIVLAGVTLFGLLLSFSRGAWFHFSVSLLVVIALDFLTAPTPKARMRIFGMTIAGIGLGAALLAILLSFDSIGKMFAERAQLIQYYDVGQGGRFLLQELALTAVLNFPNGMGPFEFSRVYGLQQHNVYLQAFLVYGWAGGVAYILLVLSTLWVGFRNALKRTPWQGYAIAAFGAFFGEVVEGFVIDTDHWRHFFLILGIIWGLAAASRNAARQPGYLPSAAT